MAITKKCIVITSINEPTEAVKAFAALKDYTLIVVGDKKTNPNWSFDNTIYLGVDNVFAKEFATILPYNHYCRKMIGYIKAIELGAEEIIDTDDDNIPYENWHFPSANHFLQIENSTYNYVNIYEYFTKQKIWPRGLPLPLINTKTILPENILGQLDCNVGVWQGLADEDPDVDAIYRLTNNTPCFFDKKEAVVLKEGTICPFNSQNTLYKKELFPLLYLPVTVTFRFTDILRGIVAQPIMWDAGFQLGFTEATVIQKRNEHNFFKDFESEITMYTQQEKALEIAQKYSSKNCNVKENLLNVYKALLEENIVTALEIEVLEGWLKHF